jgi:hypothetical protein
MFVRPILFLIPLLLSSFPLSAETTPGRSVIGADIWARPRSGTELASLPELRALIEVFERQPDGQVIVRHGTGEEAGLWAEEMRSWLVALGIPSTRVRMEVDPAVNGELHLEVRAYGEKS